MTLGLMQLNFNYDKVIITKYLTGGGGNFLKSCLGLSDDAVLMQKNLVQMQLDGKLPIEKKLKYLLLATKQQSERQIWNDWGLRLPDTPCQTHHTLLEKYRPGGILSSRDARIHINIMKREEIRNCIDNNKFIFLGLHEDQVFISALHRWKNSKVIIFKNELKFTSTRALGNYGNNSSSSITKLQLDQSQINNLSYEWDCDWYYSRDKTVSEIKKLYDSFGLSGFNAEVISEFYDAWIEVNLK